MVPCIEEFNRADFCFDLPFFAVVAGGVPSVFFARGFLGLGVSSPPSFSDFLIFFGVTFFFVDFFPLLSSLIALSGSALI